METITSKKPIIHCYVKRASNGLFNLYSQTGNALPVLHSQHYCLNDAKKESVQIGAVNCLLCAGD